MSTQNSQGLKTTGSNILPGPSPSPYLFQFPFVHEGFNKNLFNISSKYSAAGSLFWIYEPS